MQKEGYYRNFFIVAAIWNWIATVPFFFAYGPIFAFLGMEMPPLGWESSFMKKMGGFLKDLPNTILIKSSGRAHLTV